jgi:fatty-acid peroxygenase
MAGSTLAAGMAMTAGPRPATPVRKGHGRPRTSVLAATALTAGALLYAFTRGRRPTSPFPRTGELDSTLSLLAEGYTFISSRCRRYASDVFEARLMGQRVFCTSGAEAARMFYTRDRFTRRRAVPATAVALLQDWRSVQQLDGASHRHRKRMFVSLAMEPDRVQQLAALSRHEWDQRAALWQRRSSVVVHDEAQEVLCGAVCAWAGLPLTADEVARHAREFGAMIEGAGSVGPRQLRGHLLRARSERWGREVISLIRRAGVDAGSPGAASIIAWHRDEHGRLLDDATAAVELLNVLRPAVAVARFFSFAVLALYEHPEWRARVRNDDAALERFVQEVRRYYPFFPAVGGRVLTGFEWRGYTFTKGTWVLLDLYGTNHDPRIWADPEAFRPDRFAGWDGDPFTLIPQGGGSHGEGHRCPGEDITVALMKTAVRHFASLAYDVPRQDLTIDLARLPALPRSGLVISNVRRG